jgi:hypothetical protein
MPWWRRPVGWRPWRSTCGARWASRGSTAPAPASCSGIVAACDAPWCELVTLLPACNAGLTAASGARFAGSRPPRDPTAAMAWAQQCMCLRRSRTRDVRFASSLGHSVHTLSIRDLSDLELAARTPSRLGDVGPLAVLAASPALWLDQADLALGAAPAQDCVSLLFATVACSLEGAELPADALAPPRFVPGPYRWAGRRNVGRPHELTERPAVHTVHCCSASPLLLLLGFAGSIAGSPKDSPILPPFRLCDWPRGFAATTWAAPRTVDL